MREITFPNLRQLVAFCIYMENDDGIIGKHPDYLFEKFSTTINDKFPERSLDSLNMAKFKAYAEKWGLTWDSEKEYWEYPISTPIDPVTGEFQPKKD